MKFRNNNMKAKFTKLYSDIRKHVYSTQWRSTVLILLHSVIFCNGHYLILRKISRREISHSGEKSIARGDNAESEAENSMVRSWTICFPGARHAWHFHFSTVPWTHSVFRRAANFSGATSRIPHNTYFDVRLYPRGVFVPRITNILPNKEFLLRSSSWHR